jgi:hypothetical protein
MLQIKTSQMDISLADMKEDTNPNPKEPAFETEAIW